MSKKDMSNRSTEYAVIAGGVMKRDMDLCREILLEIEGYEGAPGMLELSSEKGSEDYISYHVKLLYEAGLIEAMDASGMNSFKWYPVSLTWQGHEFLDAARDETRWNKAKSKVVSATGGLAFEFLKQSLFHVTGL